MPEDIEEANPEGLEADDVSIHDLMVTVVSHPLTRKRFETLWTRLKRDLPWLDEIHGRPHDLRITSASFVERAFGHAVAQGWLRHAAADVTDTYTMAGPGDIEEAHRWLVGEM